MSMFCGLPDAEKSSSRVLKPPGGGHSDIFGSPTQKVNHARPKYDQQNSSNISGALGTTDANVICEKTARALEGNEHAGHPQIPPHHHETDPAGQTEHTGIQPNEGNQHSGHPEIPPHHHHTDPAGQDGQKAAPVSEPQQTNGRHRVPPGGYSTGFW